MARKDQRKLFLCACLSDDPFVVFLKNTRMLAIRHWSYVKAIKYWREKLNLAVKNSKSVSNIQKQIRAVRNKILEFFAAYLDESITVEYYINFLLGIASDLNNQSNDVNERKILSKIEENLFKLYLLFDPELNHENEMEKASRDLERLWNYL